MTKAIDFKVGYASYRAPMMGHNAVATSQPLAAQAGMRMLALGVTRWMRRLPRRWR
ncbi:hypothetical protein [Kosakonia radicincitans]|uniref:hypothetical protein n=1 Tax=Kosakonia radicincitans TaxID=283686 RepID=UPI00386F5D44